MDMIKIKGKRVNSVPVLITADLKKSMDVLCKYRNSAGINSENKFMFANMSKGYIRP